MSVATLFVGLVAVVLIGAIAFIALAVGLDRYLNRPLDRPTSSSADRARRVRAYDQDTEATYGEADEYRRARG